MNKIKDPKNFKFRVRTRKEILALKVTTELRRELSKNVGKRIQFIDYWTREYVHGTIVSTEFHKKQGTLSFLAVKDTDGKRAVIQTHREDYTIYENPKSKKRKNSRKGNK